MMDRGTPGSEARDNLALCAYLTGIAMQTPASCRFAMRLYVDPTKDRTHYGGR